MDLWQYLKTVKKPIVLYGTGNGADKTVARLGRDGVKISGVFSSKGFKKNKEYAGFTITEYESLKEKFSDMVILVCFGSHLPQVFDEVLRLSEYNELYLPDVPVFGEEIFDEAFAKKHKEELTAVYNMLADEKSKNVFANMVNFKLSGKLEYLVNSQSPRSEVFELLKLNNKESFLDLGAFTGDTVEEFLNYTDGYDHITAIEPDSRNFRKLTENVGSINNITCINAAATDKSGEVFITSNHGRGNSGIGKLIPVSAVAVDDLNFGKTPTFVKIDVEGNELNAIKGMGNLIKTNHPKMQIACYHTPFDFFEIPLKILEYNNNYKIYMRHHPCFPAWDINYIFI